MQQNYAKIQAAGAELIAVSSDDVKATKATVQNLGLAYPLLSDNNRDAITAYNVIDQNIPEIARPATYILNADGTVVWKTLDTAAARVPTATILTELEKR